MQFLVELKARNELLFYFGLFNLILSVLFLVLSQVSTIEVAGTNAWHKPFKFTLSIGTYSWTIAWFMSYLPPTSFVTTVSWLIIVMLGFEILYIGIQAGRGQMSHYNLSTPFYSGLYMAMALAATVVAFITLILAVRFFTTPLPNLPDYYVWSIRLGLLLFFIFSMEGFVMGSRLSHTIGANAGGRTLPILNWSREYGDPRVAHFIGMHALQVLPLTAYYLLKDTKLVIGLSSVYSLLALFVLVQALNGKPFIKA